MTEAEAVHVAIDALGLEQETFEFRLSVTRRDHHKFDVDALTFEDAVAKVKAMDIEDFRWAFGDDGFEGDEIIYWDGEPEDGQCEVEIDKRKDGEPFSWVACEIVKELAKLASEKDSIRALEADELIERAVAACAKD
jgi:hypothetical protein